MINRTIHIVLDEASLKTKTPLNRCARYRYEELKFQTPLNVLIKNSIVK